VATKKQKREQGERKHLHFMAEVKQTGLEAQRKDREHRKQKEREAWREQHDKKHSWKKRLKECPICQDVLRAEKSAGNNSNPVKETI
jgi:hypothetical protein